MEAAMKRIGLGLAATVASTLCLAGCGGGGGGGAGLASTPTPVPTPTPTPTPTPATRAVKIFPDINVSTDFATLGIEANRVGNSPRTLTTNGFSVRYDASSGVYVMDFPSAVPAGFYEFGGNTPNATWWGGELLEPNGNAPASVAVLKPSNPQLQLSYTSLAIYDTSGMSPEPYGAVAFGTATPTSAMPVTGSASYSAFVAGSTFDNQYYIRGSASLSFDFGAGTLSGHLDPLIYDMSGGALSLGRYSFTNTVFGVGSNGFSGQLTNPAVSGTGAFTGLFTGPAAQELMARWQAPFVIPYSQTTSQMFGVFVGKKD